VRVWLTRLDRAELGAIVFLAGFVFCLAAPPLVISMIVSPEAIERGDVQLSPPCPIRMETGEDCPTCGMTRAFTALSRLRIDDAIAYNAGAPWVYLVFWLFALSSGVVLVRIAIECLRRVQAPSTSQLSPSS
jgi:hypothetical protein